MKLPAIRDWQKVKDYLHGKWPLPDPKYLTTSQFPSCVSWLERATSAPYVAIDTEYVVDSGYLLLVGLGYPGAESVLQFSHREASWLDRAAFARALMDLVKRVPVVFQNAVADIPILEQAYDIKYEDYKQIDDTMLAHAVLWSDWPHTLEFLASIYGKHNKFKHLSVENPELYNAGDVIDTISAWEGIQRELHTDKLSRRIYETQSLRVVHPIIRSQRMGLAVNKSRVEAALNRLPREMEWAEAVAQTFVGRPINIGSDDQLKYEIYTVEGLPKQYVAKSNPKRLTIDGDAIAALRAFVGPFFDPDEEAKFGLSLESALARVQAGAHPLLEARVVYSAAQHALSHYINPLCVVDDKGGLIRIRDRVYPRFLAHAQASGRWSTIDPPLAQFPKNLQDTVCPNEGERWIEWDWDQIELRILAALSGDEIYREAFQRGWDIHTLNTCDVFGWPYPSNRSNPHSDPRDKDWRASINWGGKDDPRRRFAKVFIFRLNYGGEAKTATDIPGTKQLGLDSKALVIGSLKYIKKHPWIRTYWDKITKDGIQNLEVRTFMGRRRRLLVEGKNSIKRLIYNHPMQGGVSDIFNTTLVNVSQFPELRFVYGVHDNQKWAVSEDKYDEYYSRVYEMIHTPWTINGEKILLPATFKKG